MNALVRRRLRALAIAFAVATVATAAMRSAVTLLPWLGDVELRLSPNRSLPASPEIAVVAVAPSSPARLGVERQTSILPRHFHAELIRGLKAAGAKVVVFDFDFHEEGDAKENEAFANEIDKAAPLRVVLGVAPNPDATTVYVPEQNTLGAVGTTASSTLVPAPETRFGENFAVPPILPSHVSKASLIPWMPDRTIRGFIVQYRDRETGQVYPHLAVAAALAAAGRPPLAEPIPFDAERLEFHDGPYRWHVGVDLEYRSRWTQSARPFPRYEYSQALSLLRDPAARKVFSAKIVVVGSDADLKDRFQTDGVGNAMGVDIVAQFVNSLLAAPDAQFGLTSLRANVLWSLALGVLAALAIGTLRPILVAFGFALGTGFAMAMPWLALGWFGVRFDVLAPVLTAALSGGLMAVLSGIGARRFDQSVGRTAGRPVEAAILFVDLKGSTAAISEMELDATRRMLHEVLETLVRTIRENGGKIERTMGDGAMAMWFRPEWRPWSLRRPPDRHLYACAETLAELVRAVETLDVRTRREYGRTVALTMGAEVGTIAGDVVRQKGHEEWSWFGIAIHLAARLQSKCGDLGLTAALGPEFASRVKGRFPVRLVEYADLKGIPGPTPVFTPSEP